MESKRVREIFIQWENLRLVYVGVLTLVFAVMVIDAYLLRTIGRPELPFYKVIIQASIPAVIANILYFAGPIMDTYLDWIGFRNDLVINSRDHFFDNNIVEFLRQVRSKRERTEQTSLSLTLSILLCCYSQSFELALAQLLEILRRGGLETQIQ